MRTKPLKALQPKTEPFPFSEFELSIGSSVTVKEEDREPYKETVLLAVHIALWAFKVGRKVTLTTGSLVEPLIDTTPGKASVHPAFARFVREVEQVCGNEADAAFERGVLHGKQLVSDEQAAALNLQLEPLPAAKQRR